MSRRASFITVLQNLHISSDLGGGEKIGSHLRITNNKARINELVPDHYKEELGSLEFNALRSAQALIFAEFEPTHDESSQDVLQRMLREVRAFLMTTWLLESNAINCEIGFLMRQTIQGLEFNSNFFFQLFTDTDGKRPATTWDRERLRAARQLHNNRFKAAPENPAGEHTKLVQGTERFSRTWYHLSIARGDTDVALKIASYCAAFESLLATSQSELSHQLSERVACLLSSDTTERILIYRQIKEAYGVRSKVVHGATIKRSGIAPLLNTSRNCDNLARSLLARILADETLSSMFEGPDENLDDYMLSTIFSGIAQDKSASLAKSPNEA